MKHAFHAGRVPHILLIVASLLVLVCTVNVPQAQAHVEEGEAPWVTSHYESGNLVMTPDSSLPQWTGPRMLTIQAADQEVMQIMSADNGTYVVFLIQRSLNVSLPRAGALIAFEGQGLNGSDQVWFWSSNSAGSEPYANDAASSGRLVGSELTVTFGRTLTPENSSSFTMKIGVPYDDFIKITTWSNGTSADSLDLESLTHMGLEIFPYIDHYPKIPLAYGAVILVAAFAFLFSDLRKYGGR